MMPLLTLQKVRVGIWYSKQFYFNCLALAIFLDLMLTYYGITQLGLDEGNAIGLAVLQNFGWHGLGILYIVMMFLFAVSLKLVDMQRYKWTRWIIGALCAYHLYIPIQNVFTISTM